METLEIYKLTPDRLEDYLYFFENVAHTDNKEWDRCYCVDYCSARNAGMDFDAMNADERRDYAVRYVNEGRIQGYLAYQDGKVIGWCNANQKSDCLHCSGWQLISEETAEKEEDGKVKSIFCFTVAPAMRGKHVATALLQRVIADATKDGYAYIEAYPNKGETNQYYNYVGPLGLYRKLGFALVGETKERLVVRKKL